jgi:hypothetical protein
MTFLVTMTQQQMTQADEPVLPNALDCPTGIVSYWKLDETSGPIYQDFLASYDITCEGLTCPTPSVEDPLDPSIDGAQDFSLAAGTRANILPTPTYNWDPTSNFTIEFWMRVPAGTSYNRNQVIIGREAPASESELHWWVGTTRTGQANFTLKDTAGVSNFSTGVTSLHDGNWHHIAAVRMGSQGRMRIYVDGIQEGGAIADDYVGTFGSATQPINVGWLNYSNDLRFHFDGDLDELAIYRRVLTPTEIADHASHRRSYCISASVSLDKMASAPTVRDGDTVIYTYQVTNDGNEDLLSVNLTDDTCAPVTGPSGDTGILGRLEIGETWTYTCSQVLHATTTNLATVTATSATGVLLTDSDSETVTVTPIYPALTIAKQASESTVVSGDTVLYSYQVTNIGDVELTQVTVTDDKCSPVVGLQGATLAVGATADFTCSQSLTATTTNVGSVTADHQGGGTVSDDSDPVTVNVIRPELTIVKSASTTTIDPGDFVQFTYVVQNTGDDPLTNLVVSDNKCSPVFGPQNSTLSPGQTGVFTCSQTLNETTTNIGTATAVDSLGNTVTEQDSVTVRVDVYYIYLPAVFSRYP